MPRNTCGPSGCVANGNGNDNDDNGNGNQDDNQDASNESGVGIVKQEFEAAPPVCHRKSERRRVARDIFLVFEEQPTRRRGKGARGKNSRAKRKFGHLKVANTPRINKNILREIKTEPKCSSSIVAEPVAVVPPQLAPAPPFALLPVAEGIKQPVKEPAKPLPLTHPPPHSHPRVAAVKIETKTAAASNAAPSRSRTEPSPPTERKEEEHQHSASSLSPASAHRPIYSRNPAPATVPTNLLTPPTTPSVNPIFLWVKQDDTRIVEVRCEDYDKRNRIRLTKTTNGWRSMPRTDASSTRIVKFFHGSAAPLMKVKREQQHEQQHENELEHEQEQEEQDPEPEPELEDEQQHQQQMPMPTIAQSLLHDWEDSGATQLPDELDDDEEQKEEEQEQQEDEEEQDHQQQHDNLAAVIEDVVVRPAVQQSQQATTPTSRPCFDGLLVDGEETNASTKATKTNTPTYQSSTPSPMELQLCPKTGLFLPQGQLAAMASAPVVSSEADKSLAENGEEGVGADTVESLDCNTKNLKDLLDDADDLLQNCSSDNGSNGADLLDSLVKRSCEDNLVHASGPANGGPTSVEGDVTTAGDGLGSFCVANLGKDLPSMLHMDNDDDDAPKCLSFNEAGEIEGLNGELFLGIAAFEKQQEEMARTEHQQPATPATVELTQTPTPTPTPTPPMPEIDKQTAATASADEAPKDLSYKKREEVCPPSESRSQCAVTSSSDILKSPERELQQPVNSIPAEVETTSETIKNLILEQFLKLNGNQQQQAQQAEPMDLGKAGREGKLETVVVIHDDDDEEDAESNQPLKKRPKASIKMDKDPDALTQLKMLISNPQWKVPDPILVPKDRLGAVLASPAREIPLLLTTRPELRLPEAFAYPEIIQNPNILVVTMEQLEAILKTEADQAKAAQSTDPVQMLAEHHPPLSKARSPSPSPSLKHSQPHKTQAQAPPSQPKTPVVGAPVAPTPPSPADSSLSTSTSADLNATTLALLQQMLWLPYFGQLSQELFKTIKDPLAMQRKFMSDLLPLYNSQFGLQHLDELYKHCLKQKAAGEHPTVSRVSTPAAATVAVPHPPHPPVAVVPPAAAATNSFGVNGFANPMELAIMQKLLQPQMPNFPNWEATKDASVSGSASSSSQHHHHQEHKRPRRDTESKATAAAVAPPAAAAPSPAPAPVPAPAEHKPRLTCKSLSNLLEPEPIVPLLNVPFDSLRRTAAPGHGSKTGPEQQQSKEANPGRLLRSSKACVTYNPLEQVKQQIQHQQQHSQQRKRATSNMLGQDAHQQQQQLAEAAAVAASAGGMDANSALWHPLFGSNPKQGYNSPWQWTTVTATGE